MKVLVTGARGQLARSLIERARDHPSIEVIAIGRPELELETPGSATRVIATIAPDLVINAAAYTAVDRAEDEPERAFRINSEAAGEIAAGAAKAGAPLIQISTDFVFDGTAPDAHDESAPTNPLSVYGRSKLAGEEQVRAANPSHIIVRTAWVFSPFGGNFVSAMMAAAAKHRTLTVVTDQIGSPTSALDLADGLLCIAEQYRRHPEMGFGELYHFAGTGSTSRFDFAQAIMDECRRLGLPFADLQPISTADWPAKAERPRNSALNSWKFARDFGYSMRAWEDSLAETVSRLSADQ